MAGFGKGVRWLNHLQQKAFRLRGYGARMLTFAPLRRVFGRGKRREMARLSGEDTARHEGRLTSGQLPLISIVFAAERRMFRQNLDGGLPKAGLRGALVPSLGPAGGKGAAGDAILSPVKADMVEIEVVFSPDGRVCHANEAACGVTYGLGDCLIGQHIGELFGPRLCDGAEIDTLWAQALAGQTPQGGFQMHPGEETARIVHGWLTAAREPEGRGHGVRFRGVEAAANGVGPVRAVPDVKRARGG